MNLSVEVAAELRTLEESLWLTESRFDKNYIEQLFAPDFFEFGCSGRTYNREQLINVARQKIDAKLPLSNFEVHILDAATVLVTYVSEVKYEMLEKANRSSIWSKTSGGWQIRFHQGTLIKKL